MAAKKTTNRKSATAKKTSKKLSQMAAAEKILASAREPMSCKELVEAMAKKRVWKSPGGKTPDAALLCHIRTKGRRRGLKRLVREKVLAEQVRTHHNATRGLCRPIKRTAVVRQHRRRF